MQFNQDVIEKKMKYMNRPSNDIEFVKGVIRNNLKGAFELKDVARSWTPGGGAALFQIIDEQGNKYFLKVKHREIKVESKLEEEPAFSSEASLFNEYSFFHKFENLNLPKIIFFDEKDEYQFLAVEWIEESFFEFLKRASAVEILDMWSELETTVKKLYEAGVVHTDLHEENIRSRNGKPVIIDFEEARNLKQSIAFEKSLDFVGYNSVSNVGDFPKIKESVEGLTCLARLKLVVKNELQKKLPELINSCHFDNTCPFNLDVEQQPDPRVYQSLKFDGISIDGHRPKDDSRLKVLIQVLNLFVSDGKRLCKHTDIGSNIGAFCFEMAKSNKIEKTYGVEAFAQYINLARAVVFLYDMPKIQFVNAVCGEDDFSTKIPSADLVSIFSVYHHIKNRDLFWGHVNNLKPKVVLCELATQERYFPERKTLDAELAYIQKQLNFAECTFLGLSKDYNRPIYIFSKSPLNRFKKLVFKVFTHRYFHHG